MRKILLLALATFFLAFTSSAQLPDGSIAPDWTFTDINGNSHTLYDDLDAGKTVIIDVMATWCGPCWSYAQTGALEDLWADHGPDGTDDLRIYMFEADDATNQADLEGTGANTTGDWISITPYPIIDNDGINGPYAIGYYPTIYTICPSRVLVESGQASAADHWSYIDDNCAAATESLDAGILAYLGETATCSGGDYIPSVRIQNLSASGTPLTACDINTYVDGTLNNTYNWTGSLDLYDFEDVTLPAITGISGAFNVECEVVYAGDTGTDNNSVSADVILGPEGDNNLTLEIQLDNWPDETTWEIEDASGTIIASGGPYTGQNDALIFETITAAAIECHKVTFFDSFGDGFYATQWGAPIDGYFKLTDSQGTVLAESQLQEEWEERTDVFGVASNIGIEDINALTHLNVFPNPATNNMTVNFSLDTDSQVSFEVFNLLGERVYVSAQDNFVGNNSVTIDVSNLTSGMYTLNMIVDGDYTTTKVTVTK
ncbi:MAG: T9SS type A sorting domain-containing protein [Flavobacteriales bacterium]|nr:T9SS type A sorting domain-containing protein [Flavobacteriales bacterium]